MGLRWIPKRVRTGFIRFGGYVDSYAYIDLLSTGDTFILLGSVKHPSLPKCFHNFLGSLIPSLPPLSLADHPYRKEGRSFFRGDPSQESRILSPGHW